MVVDVPIIVTIATCASGLPTLQLTRSPRQSRPQEPCLDDEMQRADRPADPSPRHWPYRSGLPLADQAPASARRQCLHRSRGRLIRRASQAPDRPADKRPRTEQTRQSARSRSNLEKAVCGLTSRHGYVGPRRRAVRNTATCCGHADCGDTPPRYSKFAAISLSDASRLRPRVGRHPRSGSWYG